MSQEPAISVQRFSLALSVDGKPRLSPDMQGDVVRYPDHISALNTERELAEAPPPKVEPPEPVPAKADFHPARRDLDEAVKTLRGLGWSDGDIIFAAGLQCEPSTFIASTTPKGDQDGE